MPTVNLGQVAGIHYGTVAPTNTKMLWYDENIGQKVIKFYDTGTTTWKNFDGVGTYLPLTGGTVTGFITLHADPTAVLHAASKQYVDAAVAGVVGTLAAVLLGGNVTGGTDIDMTSGDNITWNVGSGGILASASTTGARTWTLPDATGTLLLGTGTTDKLARWSSGALADGIIDDDGTTAGIGGLSGTTAFSITTTLANGLVSTTTNTTSGTAVYAIASGVNSSIANKGGYFEGNDSLADNVGIHGVGDANSNASPATARGGEFEATGGVDVVVGSESYFTSIGTESVGVLGRNNIAAFSGATLIAGLYGGLDENGIFDIGVDKLDIHAAVIGQYIGTAAVASDKYAGYFLNEVTNAADVNFAGYFKATGGVRNYAIITGGGFIGLGVAAPTKQLEISSGTGIVTFDTTGVTVAYNYNTLLTDTNVTFTTSIARGYTYSVNGTITEGLLATGGLAVGPHTSVDSHLHVKFSGGLADMDGGIRGTMSNVTPYVYATPAFANSLVLENEDNTANNTNGIVFRSKDTGGTSRDTAFISTRYHTRAASTLAGDLVFGVSALSALVEVMRLHSSANVSIGAEAAVSRLYVLSDVDSNQGILKRQDNSGVSAGAYVGASAKNSAADYVELLMVATGDQATSVGNVGGVQKYFTQAGHVYTDGDYGHLNLFARSANGISWYDIRMFTGGADYDEANLRMTLKEDGKFGFNLAKAGYTGAGVDTPLSNFHVGTGALFEADGSTGGDHFIIKNDSVDGTDYGGLVLTGDVGFSSAVAGNTGYKFTTDNTDSGSGTADDSLKLGLVDAAATQTWLYEYLLLQDGKTTIGSYVLGEEALTVDGVLSLTEQALSPSNGTNYGKLYSKTDQNLYYLDATGAEYQLNQAPNSNIWNVRRDGTAASTAADGDFILIDAATHVVSLPPPVANNRIGVKMVNVTVTDVTVETDTGGEVDGILRDTGAGGLALSAQWDTYVFICDGADWFLEQV